MLFQPTTFVLVNSGIIGSFVRQPTLSVLVVTPTLCSNVCCLLTTRLLAFASPMILQKQSKFGMKFTKWTRVLTKAKWQFEARIRLLLFIINSCVNYSYKDWLREVHEKAYLRKFASEHYLHLDDHFPQSKAHDNRFDTLASEVGINIKLFKPFRRLSQTASRSIKEVKNLRCLINKISNIMVNKFAYYISYLKEVRGGILDKTRSEVLRV